MEGHANRPWEIATVGRHSYHVAGSHRDGHPARRLERDHGLRPHHSHRPPTRPKSAASYHGTSFGVVVKSPPWATHALAASPGAPHDPRPAGRPRISRRHPATGLRRDRLCSSRPLTFAIVDHFG